MWDKVRLRERERRLGMLFGVVCAALAAYVLFFFLSSAAAKVVGGIIVGFTVLIIILQVRQYVRNRPGPAPVGALSPDERIKARSKLLKSGAGPSPGSGRGSPGGPPSR